MARGDAAEDGGARPAGMGSGTWRKAYGALKDSTKVGLANFNSEYKVMTTMPCLRCPIDRSIGAHLFTRRAGRRRPASRPMAFDCHLPSRLFAPTMANWPLPIVKAF